MRDIHISRYGSGGPDPERPTFRGATLRLMTSIKPKRAPSCKGGAKVYGSACGTPFIKTSPSAPAALFPVDPLAFHSAGGEQEGGGQREAGAPGGSEGHRPSS